MKSQTNIILVDFETTKEEFELLNYLKKRSNEEWNVKCYVNNFYPRLIRQLTYFVFPFLFFLKIDNYKKIVAWQQFYGIMISFYCRLFHLKKDIDLTVMTFIYKPKNGLIGKIYYRFMKYALESNYIKHVICFSSNEVSYYKKLFKQEFEFCPYGIKDSYADYASSFLNPQQDKKGYFLACGRSNRDYDFLLKEFRSLPFSLKVICDELKYISSENITILNNVNGKAYYELLSKCYSVVIPLKDLNISSGQMVLLEAMMFGKPVIVTDTKGIHDYITQHTFLIDNNKNSLRTALNKVLSIDIKPLSLKIRTDYLDNFTCDNMNKKIFEIIYHNAYLNY